MKMFKISQFNEYVIKKYGVEFSAGTSIFKQNDKGNSLFIIIEGKVQLTHKLQNQERLVAILGEGEILGEKALLKQGNFKRCFTALAMTDSTLLEIGPNDLKTFESIVPDFMTLILASMISRLYKATILISILGLTDISERLIEYLLYLCEFFGKKTTSGISFSIRNDVIAKNINVEKNVIEKCMKNLLNEKVVLKIPEGYIVPDENALTCYLPKLKERLAA